MDAGVASVVTGGFIQFAPLSGTTCGATGHALPANSRSSGKCRTWGKPLLRRGLHEGLMGSDGTTKGGSPRPSLSERRVSSDGLRSATRVPLEILSPALIASSGAFVGLESCTFTTRPFVSALTSASCRPRFTCTPGHESARELSVSTTARRRFHSASYHRDSVIWKLTRLKTCCAFIRTGWPQRRASSDSLQRWAPRAARWRR